MRIPRPSVALRGRRPAASSISSGESSWRCRVVRELPLLAFILSLAIVLCIVPAVFHDTAVHTTGDHPLLTATATTWRTALSVFFGIGCAMVLGYIVGLLLALIPKGGKMIPLWAFRAMGGVPVVTWLYVLMVPNLPFDLDGKRLPGLLVFVTALFPIAIAVHHAVVRAQTSPLVLHLQHLGARRYRVYGVLLISALPHVLDAAQVTVLLGWSLAIFAEASGVGSNGFGLELAQHAKAGSASLLTICLLGLYLTILAFLSSHFLSRLANLATPFRIS